MKRISYILIFFVSIVGNAQEYFNRTYPQSTGVRAIIEMDTNYLAVGQEPTIIQRKIKFYNIKRNGDTNWVREYYDSLKIFYAMKALVKNNELFVFGAMKDSAGIDNADLFLASFDLDANLNWMKRYGGVYFDNGWDFKETPDGGFILAGSQTVDTLDFEDFYLLKTDSVGTVEWEQSYGGNGAEIAYSVCLTSDGGYLFSGYSSSYSSSYDCLVFKIDSLGNELWHQKFGENFSDNAGVALELTDQSYLVSTAFRSSTNQLDATLLKLDFKGRVIWQKSYPWGTFSRLNIPIIQNSDGTIVLGGIVNFQNNYRGRLMKIDLFGSEIWEREYFTGSDIYQDIYDLKPTSDGNYIFCGTAWDTTINQRAWVVKLDCFGCDSTLCYYQDSVCDVYDCTQFPITADFVASDYSINLAYGEDTVSFVNSSANTTNRVWDFGNDSIAYTDSVFTQVYNTIGTYDVSLIVYHGMCSDTVVQTVTVVNDLGLTEWEREWERVLIYPNPNQGSFTISNHTNKAFEIEVTDALGKLVYQGKVEKKIEQLQLHLDNGIYTGRFSQNGYQYQQKIIIQK